MAKHPGKCPKCGERLEFESAAGPALQCAHCGATLRTPRKASAEPDPLIGQTLGDFEVIELLGRGGMGAVYKARQGSLDRLVALKVLPDSFSRDAGFLERFRREARAAAAVSHPNIIEIYSVGQDRGHQFIAMEFVDGETLADVLGREGGLPPARALDLMKQVTEALAEAHACGVLHRDIKPANILVPGRGRVKVADFGLAKRPGTDVSVTVTGQSLGTPLYMPPEVARGQEADARSDLYSLGATFYQVLTGKPPFDGVTPAELIIKHIEGTVPPLADAAPEAPPALARTIHRLLRKNPAERYQTAVEVLEALQRVEGQITARQAAPTATMPPGTARASKTTRRHAGAGPRARPLALIIGGSIVASVLIGVLVFALTRGGKKPATQAAAPEAPATSTVTAPEASADASETYAFRLFDRALEAAKEDKWLSVESYLRRLDKDYASTRFVASNQAAIEGLRKRLEAAQGKPPTPPTPTPPIPPTPQPLPPVKPEPPEEWTTLPNGWRVGKATNLGPGFNTSEIDRNPYVSADGLTLLFQSERPGGLGGSDLYACTRRNTADPWGPPANLGPPVNTPDQETDPCLAADGLTLWFSSKRPGGHGAADIWVSTRRSAAEPWGQPQNLGPTVNSSADDYSAAVPADGLTLIFHSNRPGGFGKCDLWTCTRPTKAESWGPPVNLGPTINTKDFETNPRLAPDGMTLFFQSDRPGGEGSWDLWMSTRRSATEPFGAPVNLGPSVNGPGHDGGASVPADCRMLYFHSDRPGGSGNLDLWQAPILPPGAPLPTPPPDDEARWGPWEDLFDGKTLEGWNIPEKVCDHPEHLKDPTQYRNAVKVSDGQIVFEPPGPRKRTFIAWSRPFPTSDYELAVEAQRVAGAAELCCIVFPSGAGGSDLFIGNELVKVLSREETLAEGSTSTVSGRWYQIHLRVTVARVQAWVDGRCVVDLAAKGRPLDWYRYTNLIRCFAVGSDATKTLVRSIRLRRLKAEPPPDDEARWGEWVELFDGKTLTGWRVVEEGGEFAKSGKVLAENGRLVLEKGNPATGIAWTRDFPRVDYEVSLEAMYLGGNGLKCDIVIPVQAEECKLVVGGWADGTVVALDLVDGRIGAGNLTTRKMALQEGRWYRVRLRVTAAAVEAWVDDGKMVDFRRAGHVLSLFPAVVPMRPFGLRGWETKLSIRNLRLRRLKPEGAAPLPPPDAEGWTSLFDGKTLHGWKVVEDPPEFVKHGQVTPENGELILEKGAPATGIAWQGQVPRVDYEVSLEAKRLSGTGSMCEVFFPFNSEECKFAVAGDNKMVCLEQVDGRTGPNNLTRRDFACQDGRWYRLRLRVTAAAIEAWVDDDKVIDLNPAGHKFSLHPNQFPLRPFGLRTWNSHSAFRNIRLRRLKPEPPPPEDEARWGPWEELFDGKTLDAWKVVGQGMYAGHGEVRIEAGELVLEKGSDLTALAWAREFPETDYEVLVEVLRRSGVGGPCAIGFRFGTSGAALIPDPYRRGTIDLGQVGGQRLVEPLRASGVTIEDGKWYRIRLRVTKDRLVAWVDDRKCLDVAPAGRPLSALDWAQALLPFGVSTWKTTSAFRSIRLRRLKPEGAEAPKAGAWKVYTDWPFDEKEAKRRQEETAKALGVTVEQIAGLGNGVTMTMVLIPAGEFLMGSPPTTSPEQLEKAFEGNVEKYRNEFPQHRVKISKPFWLGKTEVTQAQWEAVMGDNPSKFKGRPQNPVEQVSWNDCQGFLKKLSAKLEKPFRLPTEAEWEYACRAGAATDYYFGETSAALGDYAWWTGNAGGSTQPVGRKKPNAWGLHDMLGNLWEWCEDWFGPYGKEHQTDPRGPAPATYLVVRGGAWGRNGPLGFFRCASRSQNPPSYRFYTCGFRASRTIDVAPQPQPGAQALPPRVQQEGPRPGAQATEADPALAKLLGPVEAKVAAWDFAGAAAELEKAVGGASLPRELAERVAIRREEVGRMAEVKAKMIERINTAKPPLRKSSIGITGINADLKADEKAVTARLVTGKVETYPWKDLEPDTVQRLVGYTAKSADDHLAAGILLLASGDAEGAERHFGQAKEGGVAIDRYLDPLAEAAFASAQALLARKDWKAAEAALADIEKQYGKAGWFAQHNDEVTAARAQAHGGAGEPTAPPNPPATEATVPTVPDKRPGDASEANVQGNYEGAWKDRQGGSGKATAMVVALGGNTYKVTVTQQFAGGRAAKVELDGRMEGGRVVFAGNGWSGAYANAAIAGEIGSGGTFQLSRVIGRSPSLDRKPPRGAIVVFDGQDFDGLTKRDADAKWQSVEGGGVQTPRGGMATKATFTGSFDLHIEFLCPLLPERRGQARGNSGVFLPNGQEIQVLDSFGMETYLGGGCGALYRWKDPDANAILPPLTWQTYDIQYRVRQDAQGRPAGKPRVTVFLNGIKIHDNVELQSAAQPGQISFQDHGDPVCYRNIWLVTAQGR